MSEQAAIDAMDFARHRRALHGKIPAAQLERLRGLVSGDDAMVEYSVSGGVDDEGRLVLDLGVRAVLPLVCQRCLEPFGFPLDRRSRLLLAKDERQYDELDRDEAVEVILAERRLRVDRLVEDEILLSLPMAPMHPLSQCAAAQWIGEPEAKAPGEGG
ncbi:MAG: YceD family protein [Betaproteobacteria bacterium]|nr:YceD family protein [Betaproteobacteria bacterium]